MSSDEKLIEFMKDKGEDFPILSKKINGYKLIYLDNPATSQKPSCVIDRIRDFYMNENANVHRGIHSLSEFASLEFEDARKRVADFISASSDEIVFTKGSSEALNLLAFGLDLREGDEVILSLMEHHANIVPWQELEKRVGIKIKFIGLDEEGRLDLKSIPFLLSKKTRVLSIAHTSNVLGVVNPIKEIRKIIGKDIILILDCAQSFSHSKISVKDLDCDFLVFSAHKFFGPTGLGVLYGREFRLKKLRPLIYGGGMILDVSISGSTYREGVFAFEAGTPNISSVLAFKTVLDYIESIGAYNLERYDKILSEYFLAKISSVEGLRVYGPLNSKNRSALFSFNLEGIHAHDLSAILNHFGIASRAGHHCAMPLMKELNVSATCRVGFVFYNTLEEIDFLFEVLRKAKKIYDSGEFLKF